MRASPWAALILGLMIGTVIGYMAGESQPVVAASVERPGAVHATSAGTIPDGHPPMAGGDEAATGRRGLAERAAQLEGRLDRQPGDPEIQMSLGNLYFDAGLWQQAREWYERALEARPNDPHGLTDLAIAYRNLGQPEHALELLEKALGIEPEQWQAMYNMVVVLGVDLARKDEAAAILARLRKLKVTDASAPDLDALERSINPP